MGQSCNCNVQGAGVFDNPSQPRPPSRDPRLDHASPKFPTAAAAAAWADEHEEPALPERLETFAILRQRRSNPPSAALEVPAHAYPSDRAPNKDHWRRWYRASGELGRGVSASVFEAQATGNGGATSSGSQGGAPSFRETLFHPTVICSRGVAVGCIPDRSRQVAIKRFKKVRSRSFETELAALLRVGVHPHVLRLLESYEDCDGEDVLILEYCEGSTVFDAYAKGRRSNDFLPEVMVARLIRQLCLALEHINACGVEHQDVKPENMLLYHVNLAEQRAELKLGDFGWAVGGEGTPLPVDGAGSLWYAPPELNPPPAGVEGSPAVANQPPPRAPGRSDMWSVGVVMYLLLVGQNPFHAALHMESNKAVEAEVIRLVSLGELDRRNERWARLPQDAHDILNSLLRVNAAERPSVTEVLRHPYLLRRLRGSSETVPLEPACSWCDGEGAWANLDGFQRLAWAAIARAVSEPELRREAISSAARAARGQQSGGTRGARQQAAAETAYLWQLARELSASPIGTWLRERRAWSEIARLAFKYLDLDGDGYLGARDLVTHLAASTPGTSGSTGGVDPANDHAWWTAQLWIARWCQDEVPRSSGLNVTEFRAALAAAPKTSGGKGLDVELFDDGNEDDGNDGCTNIGDFFPRREKEEELCGWPHRN